MLRTLKIAKLIAALAAIGFIAYLAVSGLKPDEEMEAVLAKPSAVSKFRKLSDIVNLTKDKESEFVKQAKKFAIRINPPIPPKVEPKTLAKRSAAVIPDEVKTIVPPKLTRTTKFSLVSTCRYPDYPEKSLAQLNIVGDGKKWVRQGESVGHLTIHEVKDGSIVLYQGEAMNAEIFVPEPKTTKSLLKSSEDTEAIAEPEKNAKEDAKIVFEAITNTPSNRAATMSNRHPAGRKSPAISRARALRPDRSTPPPKSTPEERKKAIEEQKKTLDNNISHIQNIMKESKGTSKEGEKSDEMEAWGKLLKALEQDKQKIGSKPSVKNPKGNKGAPAKKAAKTQE